MASWQTGWRACRKCAGLVFFGSAACPAGGVHHHAQSGDYSLAFASLPIPPETEAGWQWCRLCQTLIYTKTGGCSVPDPCASGGLHDHTGSGDYMIRFEDIDRGEEQGQKGWRWCSKCQALFHAGPDNALSGACVVDGLHEGDSSAEYVLSVGGVPAMPEGQGRWKVCSKCRVLAFDGYAACAGGGAHDPAGSKELAVAFQSAGSRGQAGWRWCNACYAMVFAGGTGGLGRCPSGGRSHEIGGSGAYVLAMGRDVIHPPRYQSGWAWCCRCEILWSNSDNLMSRCPARPKVGHTSDGSGDYFVGLDVPRFRWTPPATHADAQQPSKS